MNDDFKKRRKPDKEADHDEIEKRIEGIKTEIDRKIKAINEIDSAEKRIMGKIRKALDEHELKYLYKENEPKHIVLGFCLENKPFKIYILIQNGKVIFKLIFPFRVQSNAYPLMCMFMAKFNKNKTFSLLGIDSDDGELSMEYSYMLQDPSQFDENYFWVYMTSLIQPALEIYTKAAHLSMGMVPVKEKKLYKKLLEMGIETLNGIFDDNNVSYGTESLSLEFDSLPDLSTLFEELEIEDIMPDCIHDLRREKRMQSVEELMQAKEQDKEGDEEESNTLSMFAKRNKDNGPVVAGENEYE